MVHILKPFQNNEVENDKERCVFDEEADLGWTDPEPICRGSPVGWVVVVGIYLLFAFHSHCLPTMET